MGKLTEGYFRGEFLISEANGGLSRKKVTLVSGQNVVAGEVLGLITIGGKYQAHDEGSALGPENAIAIAHEAVDATAGDADIWIIGADAVVNDGALTWPAGIAGNDKTDGITSLMTVGIEDRLPV